MKRYMTFTVCIIALIISGCNEPQTPSEKQSRLIAAENLELKEQIKELRLEIEKLKEQHQKELEVEKSLLADAQKEIDTLKVKSKQNVRDQVQDVFDAVIQQNTDLRKEIEKLKSGLENQRKQVSALEKMLTEKSEQ